MTPMSQRRRPRPRAVQTKDKVKYYDSYAEAKAALERAQEYGNKRLEIRANPRTGRFYLSSVSPEK